MGVAVIGTRRTLLTFLLLLPLFISGWAASATAGPNCKCRYFGQMYSLGDTVCIRTSRGLMVARCTLNQNVTSWKLTKRTCQPVSQHDLNRIAPAKAPITPVRYSR